MPSRASSSWPSCFSSQSSWDCSTCEPGFSGSLSQHCITLMSSLAKCSIQTAREMLKSRIPSCVQLCHQLVHGMEKQDSLKSKLPRTPALHLQKARVKPGTSSSLANLKLHHTGYHWKLSLIAWVPDYIAIVTF